MTTAMGKTPARVATAATFTALYAAWHLTSGMHGTIVHLHTPSAIAAVTTSALATSQCQNLPLSPTPSPAPSSTASPTSAGQLCVSVQAAQDSVHSGKTASWTIQVQVRGGPATSVAVTLATIPSGPIPVFTGSCPSGGGTTSCIVGDMGNPVTPATYQLQAQVAVPAGAGAGPLTLIASADTNPIMAAIPAAGQTITITATPSPKPAPVTPSSKPTPARTAAPTPAATQPVTAPAAVPTVAELPTAAAVLTAASETTAIPPGSVSGVLPQITPAATATPVIATTPAVATTTIDSRSAANIQPVTPSPANTAGADSFTFSVGMSARTAEVLSVILLSLILTLVTARLVSSYLAARRHGPRAPDPARRPRPTRAERRATRELNWRRHLESQRTPPALEMEPAASATVQSVERLD
jgi:hypothetical protein